MVFVFKNYLEVKKYVKFFTKQGYAVTIALVNDEYKVKVQDCKATTF